jgi:hypothetical protein
MRILVYFVPPFKPARRVEFFGPIVPFGSETAKRFDPQELRYEVLLP